MPTRSLSRLVCPALSLVAALLAVVAAALVVVAATAPAHAPEPPAAGLTVVTGPVVTGPVVTVLPAAFTSTVTGPRYYTHHVATVIRVPNTDPASPTYTPPVCLRRQVLLSTGTYSYGTTFGWEGNAYDRDGVFLRGGFYTWSDCLFASPGGGYLQLSRLQQGGKPDDATPDTAIIIHPREVPDWLDADATGRFAWGSFLSRAD